MSNSVLRREKNAPAPRGGCEAGEGGNEAPLRSALEFELADTLVKAWDSLARYKFFMFGYHAAEVVKLNRRLGRRGNPFKCLVDRARMEQAELLGTFDSVLAAALANEHEAPVAAKNLAHSQAEGSHENL